MDAPLELWLPLWSRIIGLDGLTYHVGLPLIFCLISLLALASGRVLISATRRID